MRIISFAYNIDKARFVFIHTLLRQFEFEWTPNKFNKRMHFIIFMEYWNIRTPFLCAASTLILTASSTNRFNKELRRCFPVAGYPPGTRAWPYFLWSEPEQTVEETIETFVIWNAIALIMTSLQRPSRRKKPNQLCYRYLEHFNLTSLEIRE